VDPAASNTPILKTFGALRLEAEGTPISGPVSQRHRMALLALLAATPGHQLTRDRVLALLWPESDAHQGRTLLNTAVHAIRRALGPDVLQSVGDALFLDPEKLESDVARYAALIDGGRPELAAGLYEAPFLDGFHLSGSNEFEDWQEQTRQRLATEQAGVLERLATAATSRGELGDAAHWWRALTRHLPFSHQAVVRLLEVLEAAGEHAEALEVGEHFAARLKAELGMEPGAELAAVLARLRSRTGPRAPRTRPANAPTAPAPSPGVPASARTQVAQPPRRPPWRMVVAAGGLLGLVSLVLGWPASGDGPPLDANLLLVVPFEYAGPPDLAYLSEGVVDLLAARLEPGDGARILRPRPLLAEWNRRQFRSPEERQRAAVEAAQQAGAGKVLLGSLTAAEGRLVLSGTVVDAGTAREGRSLRGVSGPADSLLALVDQLTTEVLIRQVPGDPERELGMLAGRPLPAVHLYLRGEAAYRRGLWDQAANHFQHALERDTTFAHAALGLLRAENFGRNTPRWQWARNIVQAHLGQLSRAEFLMFDSFVGQPLQRRLDNWTEVVVLVPDQPEGWYALGDLQYHYGSLLGFADPQARALAHFNKALSLDSTFAPALHHVVELLAGQRQLDSLRPWARRYFAAAPPAERTTTAIAWLTAAALGDSAWIRQVRDRFPTVRGG